jgi:hypothetical protein
MKKRFLYAILFGLPGFFLAGLLAVLISGLTAGALWLFALGDNPWPASVATLMTVMLVLVFLGVWLAITAAGFLIGKHLESNPKISKAHLLISGGVTLVFVLGTHFYQSGVGNIGPKSDGIRCSDFCSLNGFGASSMPPRNSGENTCSCLDQFGRETLKVPVDSLH